MVNNPPLTNHTVAIYETHQQAEAAIKSLSDAGYKMEMLSIIGQNYHKDEQPVGFLNTGDRMLAWGKQGAFWGSIWGLLLGSAMIVIPGVGQIMFAGWVVAMLEGAVIGGGVAALMGALASVGVPPDTAIRYETAIRAGNFLVLAHGSVAEIERAKGVLDLTPATSVDIFEGMPQALSDTTHVAVGRTTL